MNWFRHTPPDPPPATPAVEVVARPLVLGHDQNYVEYARFRLDQIRRHMDLHLVTDRWRDGAQTEVYSLIHVLRVRGAISPEEATEHFGRFRR